MTPSASFSATETHTLTRGAAELARTRLGAYVELTSGFPLDPWQQILCARLEQLAHQRGQRILIHAPPQHGKSAITSQRFPSWLLGNHPLHRVKLACYNITHARKFSRSNRDVMQTAEYAQIFPEPGARLPPVVAADEWSTMGRLVLHDAQPSFGALGLVTGFVGQGADTLIIDDPYASPQDALSPTIRESVWTFWDESARVRLTDDSNVVVMFHRYHTDDLAGRLLKEGGWEVLRFAAEADGGEDDPTGREPGEYLSQRRSPAFYEAQKMKPRVWLGQFQGRPTPPEGRMFQRKWLQTNVVEEVPTDAVRVRRWDLAASEDGDWTVGVLMARTPDGRFWIEDVVRFRERVHHRNDRIRRTAEADQRKYPHGVTIIGPEDPAQAGKTDAAYFRMMLAGYNVKTERESGSKEQRAQPLADQMEGGNVMMKRADWNEAFVSELEVFPSDDINDDQVDAAAGAFNELALGTPPPEVFSLS